MNSIREDRWASIINLADQHVYYEKTGGICISDVFPECYDVTAALPIDSSLLDLLVEDDSDKWVGITSYLGNSPDVPSYFRRSCNAPHTYISDSSFSPIEDLCNENDKWFNILWHDTKSMSYYIVQMLEAFFVYELRDNQPNKIIGVASLISFEELQNTYGFTLVSLRSMLK